ncbi:MAG: tyrosine recombinase XerD, partial [Mycoplasmataceae bacterium RV_VA103A]
MNYKYLNYLKIKNLSPNTINVYRLALNYFQNSLTTENITKFIKKLAKNREPATCQLYLAALISYSKYLKIHENIEWEQIKCLIPRKMRKFFTTISEKELSLLKQARFEKNQQIYERNNLILDFLFYSGIRVSELVNIKHRDWQDNSLRIQGKGNKVRYVFLPPFLVKYIQPGAKGYLFTNQGGRKILTDKVREIIRERTKLAGLKK